MATVPVFKMLPSAWTDRYFNRKIIKQHGLVHDGVSVAAVNRMRVPAHTSEKRDSGQKTRCSDVLNPVKTITVNYHDSKVKFYEITMMSKEKELVLYTD